MKTANGNPNVLTQDQEHMRLQVIDLELKARYWKAQHDIRFYTLESEKLQTEYNVFLTAEKAKQEEAMKRFQQQIDEMNKEAAEKEQVKDRIKELSEETTKELTALKSV